MFNLKKIIIPSSKTIASWLGQETNQYKLDNYSRTDLDFEFKHTMLHTNRSNRRYDDAETSIGAGLSRRYIDDKIDFFIYDYEYSLYYIQYPVFDFKLLLTISDLEDSILESYANTILENINLLLTNPLELEAAMNKSIQFALKDFNKQGQALKTIINFKDELYME